MTNDHHWPPSARRTPWLATRLRAIRSSLRPRRVKRKNAVSVDRCNQRRQFPTCPPPRHQRCIMQVPARSCPMWANGWLRAATSTSQGRSLSRTNSGEWPQREPALLDETVRRTGNNREW